MRTIIALLLCGGTVSAQTLCPDGTYVSGDCTLAPDGSYVGTPGDESRFTYYDGTTITKAVIAGIRARESKNPKINPKIRQKCESEALPGILRSATTRDLFYPYTDDQLASFKESGLLDDLGIEPPEPIPGVSESDLKEIDSMVIDGLIANYQARVEFCVFIETGGLEWAREHPEEFRKLMQDGQSGE